LSALLRHRCNLLPCIYQQEARRGRFVAKTAV
jgi:hypothetical protein